MKTLSDQLMKYKEKTTGLYQRGEVYYARLDGVGSEQQGIRPVLILQNNTTNRTSTTLVVICLTTKHKKMDLNSHVALDNGISVALCEQIRTIDKARLDDYAFTISDEDLEKVSTAVRRHLCL